MSRPAGASRAPTRAAPARVTQRVGDLARKLVDGSLDSALLADLTSGASQPQR